MNKRIVISGWYGISNIGSEAILHQLLTFLKKYTPSIKVFSWNPAYTKEIHGVDSISQFSITDILKCIKRCDIFILAGGDLIDDIGRGLLFWLSKPSIARLFKKRVVMWAVGVKYITSPLGKFILRRFLRMVDLVTTRDKYSYFLFRQLEAKGAHLTFDPTILLEHRKKVGKKILKRLGLKHKDEIISIFLRSWLQQRRRWSAVKIFNKKIFLERFPQFLDRLAENGFKLLFIPMQISKIGNDKNIANLIQNHMKNGEELTILTRIHDAMEIKSIIGETSLVVSMRYHPLLFAIDENIPSIAISYKFSPRIKNLQMEIGLKEYIIPFNKFSPREAERVVVRVLEKREEIKNMLKERKKEFRRRAKKNFTLLKRIIIE